MVQEPGIKVGSVVMVGVVSALLLLTIVIGLQAWYYYEYDLEQTRKNSGAVVWDLANLRLDQQENINRYGWVDKNTGKVAIPIDRAMALTAERASGGRER